MEDRIRELEDEITRLKGLPRAFTDREPKGILGNTPPAPEAQLCLELAEIPDFQTLKAILGGAPLVGHAPDMSHVITNIEAEQRGLPYNALASTKAGRDIHGPAVVIPSHFATRGNSPDRPAAPTHGE